MQILVACLATDGISNNLGATPSRTQTAGYFGSYGSIWEGCLLSTIWMKLGMQSSETSSLVVPLILIKKVWRS